jgi:hypothetical protein
MGHHSIQITVDTYGHLIPGANREEVNRLAEMVENPQPVRYQEQKGGQAESRKPPGGLVRNPLGSDSSARRQIIQSGHWVRSQVLYPAVHSLRIPGTL